MRVFLLLVLNCCIALSAAAQCCPGVVKINHMLDGRRLTDTTVAQRDGFFYKISLLRYYISNFEVVYTDGQVQSFPIESRLINALQPQDENLSTALRDVRVDSLIFNIGVDITQNHRDPALYPPGHPLGFQDPTMHWGWAAGYRFVTLEGYSGNTAGLLNTNYQIHSFGDSLYTNVRVAVNDVFDFDTHPTHTISIDAEYANAVRGIEVNLGHVTHASDGEAKTMMQNFGAIVFSNSTSTDVANDQHEGSFDIKVFPNPTQDVLEVASSVNANTPVVLTDMYGCEVMRSMLMNGHATMSTTALSAGMYFVRIVDKSMFGSTCVSIVR